MLSILLLFLLFLLLLSNINHSWCLPLDFFKQPHINDEVSQACRCISIIYEWWISDGSCCGVTRSLPPRLVSIFTGEKRMREIFCRTHNFLARIKTGNRKGLMCSTVVSASLKIYARPQRQTDSVRTNQQTYVYSVNQQHTDSSILVQDFPNTLKKND